MVKYPLLEQADDPDPETAEAVSKLIGEELEHLNNEGKILFLFVLGTKYYAKSPENHRYDLTDYQIAAERVMLDSEGESPD